MASTRQSFQQQLDAVEEELQNHGRLVLRALDRSVQALLAGDEQLAEAMTTEAMAAFAARNVERADRLVIMDSVINAENRELSRRIMALGGDERMREAGLRAILISRCMERIGDNAVDIGERVAYLASGEFREFTDASHPGE